jgi:hypothetical protein
MTSMVEENDKPKKYHSLLHSKMNLTIAHAKLRIPKDGNDDDDNTHIRAEKASKRNKKYPRMQAVRCGQRRRSYLLS